MKTAMQEMIEHIQINATKFSMMNTYNMLKVIEPYLEKEKEQIIDFTNSFYDDCVMEGGGLKQSAEEYYNQTYNKNK
jgi:hypothetical protein